MDLPNEVAHLCMGASSTLHFGMCSVLSNPLSMKRETLFLACYNCSLAFAPFLT